MRQAKGRNCCKYESNEDTLRRRANLERRTNLGLFYSLYEKDALWICKPGFFFFFGIKLSGKSFVIQKVGTYPLIDLNPEYLMNHDRLCCSWAIATLFICFRLSYSHIRTRILVPTCSRILVFSYSRILAFAP